MRKFISTLFITLTACQLMASAISFKASLSHNNVSVGQRFRITFTVNAAGGRFTPPSFDDFRVLSGPNQSRSMQYVNGKSSQTFTVDYILEAVKKGTFEIGSAIMVIDGEKLETEPQKIIVVAANPSNSNAQNQRQQQRRSGGNELSDYVYIKAFADKRSAYVGEKLTATFKLYSKLNLSQINLEDLPDLNGFWSHDLRSVYDQIQLSTEYINGEVYQIATIKQTLLYPQRSGELVIDPLSMKAVVQIRSRRSRSLFESMFGSYENREVIISSQPIKVDIKPLPKYKGKGEFSGAVGDFAVKLISNKTDLKANEALDLKIEIKGEGNLPLIGAPELNFPPDLEVYDPETDNNFKNSSRGSVGSKIFNYLIIPRHSGNFIIEPYQLIYFDVNKNQYQSISTDSLIIQVARGAEEENVVYRANDRKEEVELLEQDIRFIHLSNLMLVHPDDQFYGSFGFYLLLFLFFVGILLLFFLSRRYKERQSDVIGLRKSKAKKLAVKRMSKAKKLLDQNALGEFYEEIAQALYGYFADHYNIGIADLSKEKLIDSLMNEGADETLIDLLNNTIDQAEMARYAPSASVEPQKLYENSKQIIEVTEELKS